MNQEPQITSNSMCRKSNNSQADKHSISAIAKSNRALCMVWTRALQFEPG
jgi:hypothetical protein